MGEHTDHPDSNRSMRRRQYLGVQAAATAGLVVGGAGLVAGASDDAVDGTEQGDGDEDRADDEAAESFDAMVTMDADERGERDVPETLFGRFAEHYGAHEIYPGIYAEHVTNTAFVAWGQVQPDHVSHVYGFDEVGRYDGLPFPWEPVGDEAAFERPEEGGVRGLGTWESDGGWPAVDREPRNEHQRVVLDDAVGGVKQRLPLPDWRTLAYEFGLSVRADGIDALDIRLTAPDGDVLASAAIEGLTDEWERYDGIDLELAERSGSTLEGGALDDVASPYGEYVLEIVAEGTGHVDLDWLSLLPADAVNGKFNPTTIELMDDRNVSLLKWPGGNVTSTYKWEDGIGPVEERPIRPNVVWNGLDPNLMGTAEYVEFCEVTDVEATITVGVTVEDTDREFQPPEPITPEDAANWVEYCNGSTDTEYGALRAEHGYEEPFDVQVWEIGNEVWGGWQAGGTHDPEQFAERTTEFIEAMTAVDDSITVIPDGMDPMYGDENLPDPERWNDTLFDVIGSDLDGIGMHRYNWGIRDEDPGSVEEWKAEHDADALDYNEVLLMFPTQFGELMGETADLAASHGLEEPEFFIGEWGLYPTVADGDPWPGMPTMAGASYVAGMFNAFIRQSDHVRRASHTHLPVRMFPPEHVDHPADPNPLLPVGFTLGLYASVFDGDRTWNVIDAAVDGETRDIPETGVRIRAMEDVPYVDAVSMATPDGDALCTFLTNRNLRTDASVAIEVPDAVTPAEATVTVQRPTGDPHDEQDGLGDYPDSWYDWDAAVYEVATETVPVRENGTLDLRLPPSAVARIEIEAGARRGPPERGDGSGRGPRNHADENPGRGPPEHARSTDAAECNE
ncbi:alpha-L-arabinofuranosidase [Natrinema salifodinae]|uniref:non-reducing end alpha-L-arabinofuranosidase n=1 Tax=Natrinema salifodinae TaxID=1202768 RepID=A0A1I0PJQ8_9EURY|nr:alpha-L-arabinofuranosidase [Natrinema salifodinae]SEW14602.1 alpha-N-arabinofuranosidase [Natrinema salifodinae]